MKERIELNRKKTKIKRFRKRGDKSNKMNWRWKDKVIDGVKELVKYLRYMF